MTTQYTPILQLALPVTGELNGTWGDVVNDNITSMVEEAIAGLATISTWTANAHTLTTVDGLTDEARCAMIVAQTGAGGTALTGSGNIICPARTKLYVVSNQSAYQVTIKTAAGTGIAVAAGDTTFVFCDGTNVLACVTQITNGHITGNLTVDGNTTLGDASGDTVTVNGTTTFVNANPTLSQGTANRVLFLNASKVISDAAGLTWDGTTLSATKLAGAFNGTVGATTPSTGVFTQVDITAQGDLRLQDTTGGEYVALQAPGTLASSYTLTLPVDDGTNGQALITDGSGNLSWSTAASGDVYGPASSTDNAVARFDLTTGKLLQNSGVIIDDSNNVTGVAALTASGAITLSGGTANGVAYLNASKVLTTGSALTFDGTNFLVGAASLTPPSVGTTAPWANVSNGNNGALLLGSANTGTAFWHDNGADTVSTIRNLYASTSANAQLRLQAGFLTFHAGTALSEQMRLTSTGLGIGTSSPGTKLEVSRGTTANASATGATTRSNSALAVAASSDTNTRMMFGINTNTNGWVQVQNTSSDSTADFIINPVGGNLGLGVTPSGWGVGWKAFDINTWGAIAGVDSNTSIGIVRNAYNNGTNWIYKLGASAQRFEANNTIGGFAWYTAPSGTAGNAISFTQAMTLDASGNLLVGRTSTINANARLNVQHTGTSASGISAASNAAIALDFGASTNGVINLVGGGSTGIAWSNSSNVYDGLIEYTSRNMRFNTAATERMRIDSSGNVGIGTSSPSYKLDVNGAINYGSGTLQYTGSSVPFGNNNLTLFSAAGNIGLASQYASINFPVAYATADSNGAWWMLGRSSGGDDLFSLRLRCGGAGNDRAAYFVTSTGVATAKTIDSHIWYTGTNTERMRIDSSGNLGLGVTPSAWTTLFGIKAFDISNGCLYGATNDVNVVYNAYFNGTNFIYKTTAATARYAQSNASHAWYSAASGTAGNAISFTQAMTLDASGRLLVGTTSSTAAKLVAYDGSGGDLLHIESGTSVCDIRMKDSGTTSGNIRIRASSDTLQFFTAANERMRIDSSGNVLVGTTSNGASARLALNQSADAPTIDAYCGSTTAGTAVALITKALNSNATSNVLVKFYINFGSTGSGQINANGASQAAFGSFSDARLKENVTELEPQLEKLMALRPVEFDYKDGSGHQTGFIAQEFQDVYPDAIGEADGYLTLTGYGKTEARLIKAIQEQQELINQLTARVAQLEGK